MAVLHLGYQQAGWGSSERLCFEDGCGAMALIWGDLFDCLFEDTADSLQDRTRRSEAVYSVSI